MVFGNGEAQFGGEVGQEPEVEILWCVGAVQFLYSLLEEVEHRFVLHRMAQHVKEHFGNKQTDGLFMDVSRLSFVVSR